MDRLRDAEQRVTQIDDELARAQHWLVDEDELVGALESFDPVWDALKQRERERMIRLLVRQVEYDARLPSMSRPHKKRNRTCAEHARGVISGLVLLESKRSAPAASSPRGCVKETTPTFRQGFSLPSPFQVGHTGLEPGGVTSWKCDDLRQQSPESAAECAAIGSDPSNSDSDLAAIINAWPDLPAAIRAGIVALVRATSGDTGKA